MPPAGPLRGWSRRDGRRLTLTFSTSKPAVIDCRRDVAHRLGPTAPARRGVRVVVSALALLGIAVALGWAIFTGRPQTGQVDAPPTGPMDATPTAHVDASGQPTAEPTVSSELSASAAPSATLGLAWPPAGEVGYRVSGRVWAVSAVNDLIIRSGPGAEYPAVGQLDEGDIALVLIGRWDRTGSRSQRMVSSASQTSVRRGIGTCSARRPRGRPTSRRSAGWPRTAAPTWRTAWARSMNTCRTREGTDRWSSYRTTA